MKTLINLFGWVATFVVLFVMFLYMMGLMVLMLPFMILATPRTLWDGMNGYGYIRKHWSTLPYLYVHAWLLKHGMRGMKQNNGPETVSV